jgi:single-strand DNA-binding protein
VAGDLNQVSLVGRLTRDPELSYTSGERPVCKFSIAVNRSFTPEGGQRREETSYFNIVAWAGLARLCEQYLRQGRQVAVAGRLQQRRWEAQDGTKRSTVEIVASDVQFLGSPGRPKDAEGGSGSGFAAQPGAGGSPSEPGFGAGPATPAPPVPPPRPAAGSEGHGEGEAPAVGGAEEYPDDVPF